MKKRNKGKNKDVHMAVVKDTVDCYEQIGRKLAHDTVACVLRSVQAVKKAGVPDGIDRKAVNGPCVDEFYMTTIVLGEMCIAYGKMIGMLEFKDEDHKQVIEGLFDDFISTTTESAEEIEKSTSELKAVIDKLMEMSKEAAAEAKKAH